MADTRDIVERLRGRMNNSRDQHDVYRTEYDPIYGEAMTEIERLRRTAPAGVVETLELIEVDLEAGNITPAFRVKFALSRTKAWLKKFRALSSTTAPVEGGDEADVLREAITGLMELTEASTDDEVVAARRKATEALLWKPAP